MSGPPEMTHGHLSLVFFLDAPVNGVPEKHASLRELASFRIIFERTAWMQFGDIFDAADVVSSHVFCGTFL